MRLCVVTHHLTRTDGQGRINAEVVATLAAARAATVDVVASVVDPEIAALPGVTWHRVAPPDRLPTALLRQQWFGWAARRAVLRLPNRPDVLQLNGGIVHGLACDVNVANFVHADWLRSPFHPAADWTSAGATYQRAFTQLNVGWERRAFARARRVVALSDTVRNALAGPVGIAPAKIVVIHPGVDPGQFRPLAVGEVNRLRAELGLGPTAFLVMFVGDIRSPRKNLDLVLRALPRLPADVHVAVAGTADHSPYPALATELGVAGRAHFLGRRTTDLPTLMRGADLFAFPSHYDPFALVVTEAMASGVPPVTAPTVGASAVIRSGVDGVVLDSPTDLDGLIATVAGLHADPAGRAAMAVAARTTAERLTWAAMAGRYERLYRDLIADPPREDG